MTSFKKENSPLRRTIFKNNFLYKNRLSQKWLKKYQNVFSKKFLDSIGNPKIPYSVLTLTLIRAAGGVYDFRNFKQV